MNPAENFGLASFLAKPPKGPTAESAFRGSCGRAYYFAYTTVRDILLAAKFAIPKNGKGHQMVIDLLKRSQDDDVKAAGTVLDQLRTTRNSADYEVGSVPLKGTPFVSIRAQTAVANAHTIVQAVEKVRASSPRLKIP